MPLFQPSNITPSSFAGVGGGTVSSSDNIRITWQVNGNTAMTAFSIKIFNDTGEIVHEEAKQIIQPFYPTDNKGNPQYYQYNSTSIWSDWGVEDGKEYTLQIIQYWGVEAENKVEQISKSSFISRTAPTLHIKTSLGEEVPEQVNGIMQIFQSVYQQAQNDSVEWVRWKLYGKEIYDDYYNLVDDTGTVNTQMLYYTADNMRNDFDYKIECILQTENGVQITDSAEFKNSYQFPSIAGSFSYNFTDKASNLLSWDNIEQSLGADIKGGSNDNAYRFENQNLYLPYSSKVIWDEKIENGVVSDLNIQPNWTLIWSGSANGINNKKFTPIKADTKFEGTFETTGNYRFLLRTCLASCYDKTKNYFWLVPDGEPIRSLYAAHFIGKPPLIKRYSISTEDGETPVLLDYATDIACSPLGGVLTIVGRNSTSKEKGNAIIVKIGDTLQLIDGIKKGDGSYFVDERVGSCAFNNDGTLFALATNEYWDNSSGNVYLYSVLGTNFTYLTSIQYKKTELHQYVHLSFNKDSTLLAVKYTTNDIIDELNSPKDGVMIYVINNNGAKTTLELKHVLYFNGLAGDKGGFSPVSDTYINGNDVYLITDLIAVKRDTINNSTTCLGFDPSGSILFYGDSGYSYLDKKVKTNISCYSLVDQTVTDLKTSLKNAIELSSFNNSLNWGWIAIGGSHILFYGGYVNFTVKNVIEINKTFTNDTLYSAELLDINVLDGTYTFSWDRHSITIKGETESPKKVIANIDARAVSGSTTQLEEEYMSIGAYSVVRTNATLSLKYNNNVISSIEIPQGVKNALIIINKDNFILKYGSKYISAEILQSSQQSIDTVSLTGEQSCQYLFIAQGALEPLETAFTPNWEQNTLFLTRFDKNSLSAGEYEATELVVDIYRENATTKEMKKLFSATEEISEIRDYSWITEVPYQYYAYARVQNKYVNRHLFNATPVCKRQLYYLLMETEQDENQINAYKVKKWWRFGNNISGGSVSNNNTPNFLTNFTEYRIKQPAARNSKNGTLTALLSNAENGKYQDTVEQMEELYEISKSLNTFFLKDPKGNLYMVAIAAPITQTINTKSSLQEVKISIPWEECGSAKNVSIIQIPTMQSWVDSNKEIENVSLNVKLQFSNSTGELLVTYPDDYDKTRFELAGSNQDVLQAITKDNVKEPKLDIADGKVILSKED